ncbi:MAG: dipicolinate synthase subunit DpsA [Bacillota bacterium]
MAVDWSRLRLAVLGGDDREVVVAQTFLRLGAPVSVIGLPLGEALGGAVPVPNLAEAVSEKDVLVAPAQGIDDDNTLRARFAVNPLTMTEDVLSRIKAGALFFIGKGNLALLQAAARYGFKLIEVRDRDDFAVYNSIPTAEGAIQIAMAELPITLHGSRALCIGFGRVGKTMARKLRALDVDTAVAARKSADLARVYEMGCRPVPFTALAEEVGRAAVIFNTVPAMVLGAGMLSRVRKGSLIVDLASPPGGTDFAAARELGLKAILAPGLPGKVAPKTAGEIVATVLVELIADELGQGVQAR